jgi:hypothetical protein
MGTEAHHTWTWLVENFVPAVKTVSILFTGAFGIVGLVKNFKKKVRDKESNTTVERITKWGWVSLIGIVFSTLFGFAAQIKESVDENKTKQQTVALTTKADLTVNNTQRILSPLDEPKVTVMFHIPCEHPKYSALCHDFGKDADGKPVTDPKLLFNGKGQWWKKWPWGAPAVLFLRVHFFTDPKEVKLFLDGHAGGGDLYMDVTASNAKPDRSLAVMKDLTDNRLALMVTNYTPIVLSDGRINSLLDLPGTQIVVTEEEDKLALLEPLLFTITVKNGQFTSTGETFEKVSYQNRSAYVGSFPSR